MEIKCEICGNMFIAKETIFKNARILCPECTDKLYESPVPPLTEEIDLCDGEIFIPDLDEEWEMVDERLGEWEIYGEHWVYLFDEKKEQELIARGYKKAGDGYFIDRVYLVVMVDDITVHPQRTGWREYVIL